MNGLEAALARARKGAYVLPLWWTDEAGVCQCPKGASCPSPGKHPLLEHGLQDASAHSSTLERWWQRWPSANLAVRTDDVHRIDIDLPEVAEALAEDTALPNETEVVRTPRGGMHISVISRRPAQGGPLYLQDGRKLGDLKAAGGYVLIPPSRIGDRPYQPLSPDHGRVMTVDDPREWLAQVLPAFGYALGDEGCGRRQYAALAGIIHEGEGRHDALVSYAGHVWVEGMSGETLADLLQVINERQCQPPLPDDELSAIVDHFVAKREPRRPTPTDARAHYSVVVSPQERPRIVITNRHLHEIAEDGWSALLTCNDPPVLFQHGGAIAEVASDDDGRTRIAHLGLAALKGRLDRTAEWVKLTDDGYRPARPPRDVVEDMDALPKPLPVLRGIVGTPTFAPDGTLFAASGYHASTGLYYAPSGEPVPVVPAQPDATDLKRAKQFIGQEWLADFPFVDEASRANAVAVPVTAIARDLIDGPTPLFAMDAPTPGTGKGLLAAGIGIIVSGATPAIMTEARSEEELRKRITALLCTGRSIVLFDNIRHPLESGTLSALLTAPTWSDRLLGKTQTVELPNRTVWLATGNNLQLNNEIARRTAWIRLDAKVDRPWERTNFRHGNLIGWLQRHRHELVWALLVLVQHWMAQGRPPWEGKPLGSYEAWSSVIGGILQAAGIEGFLANRDELYRRADAETEEWRAFVAAWWETHSDAPLKASDLFQLARQWDLLSSVFATARDDASERALKKRLGKALGQRRDRRYGDFFIRTLGQDLHQKTALYRLDPAA
ncbi:MAG: bifunctional DNA primase/polymerase, partial [Candidatus Limnocylindrales bacterium]